jgi:tRNA pseudouridine55 synthase
MENGIILLDKEAGLTSREVDNALEKKLGTKKIGHLGTLDPFATGLLLIGVGKGTKYLPYLDDSKKSYIAELSLGEKTLSGDIETPVSETKEVPSARGKPSQRNPHLLFRGEQAAPSDDERGESGRGTAL